MRRGVVGSSKIKAREVKREIEIMRNQMTVFIVLILALSHKKSKSHDDAVEVGCEMPGNSDGSLILKMVDGKLPR